MERRREEEIGERMGRGDEGRRETMKEGKRRGETRKIKVERDKERYEGRGVERKRGERRGKEERGIIE